jgi:hypothetical protein
VAIRQGSQVFVSSFSFSTVASPTRGEKKNAPHFGVPLSRTGVGCGPTVANLDWVGALVVFDDHE